MSFELGRALLLTEAISPEGLGRALLAAARDRVSLVRAILDVGAMTRERLEAELSRTEAPSVRAVVPARDLMAGLPLDLCGRLCAVPVRKDPRTGTVEVVVPDVRDAQGALEIGRLLGAPVRVVRAPLRAIEQAVLGWNAGSPARRANLTPPWGTRADGDGLSAAPQRAPVLELARTTPPPPAPVAWDIPLPLLRRSVHPEAPTPSQRPALLLADQEMQPPIAPGDSLSDALENALERVIHVRGPTTLIPPPAESVPPPPNTERRPPNFASSPPAASPRRSQPPPAAPPGFYADAGAVFAELRTARDRDGVLALLLKGTRHVARKVALFIVKPGAFVGWSCTPELGDPGAMHDVTIPTSLPSALAYAETHGAYLGPLQPSAAHDPILRVMGYASRDVAVACVMVLGRASVLVLADELGETMIATRRMEELARAAGEALARIVRERTERAERG